MNLFDTVPSNACAAFRNLRAAASQQCKAGRQHCEDLWRDFERLADAHFVSQFAERLHERWFEMYLTVTLLRAGLPVQCPKPGPDILLELDGRRIWIEATCATAGAPGLPDSVPSPIYPNPGEKPTVYARPTDQMVLRIRNALSEKERKFREYVRDGRVDSTDVLVIAINVHAVHGLWADMGEMMMRSLYGVGDLVLTIDRDMGTVVGTHHEQRAHVSKLSTGAAVGVQPFIDGSLCHVSAVIGSRADAVNLPMRLGDDLTLLPNLTAAVPCPYGVIARGDEWQFRPGADGWDGRRVSYIP